MPSSQTQTMSSQAMNQQLSREWLLTNGRGGFASGTPVRINTRRYHGLLVAAARPPLDRWMLLSTVLEKVTIAGRSAELANFQFDGVVHPQGFERLASFDVSNNPQESWAEWIYELDGGRVTKRLVVPRDKDEIRIEYSVTAEAGLQITFELAPFVPMRDFHHLTQRFDGGFAIDTCRAAAIVHAWRGGPRLWMSGRNQSSGQMMSFTCQPDWWNGFFYREEAHRGQDCREDLFMPGWFRTGSLGSLKVVFTARALFQHSGPDPVESDTSGNPVSPQSASLTAASDHAVEPGLPGSLAEAQDVERRLLDAADAFVVKRVRPDGVLSKTVIAGYHWFGDWGRDTFIAIPGLLYETGRFDEAFEILETFGTVVRNGLVPNRFSDYGDACDYNSADASMWYLHAATRYFELTKNREQWENTLYPACRNIVEHFVRGTDFEIYVDHDGLVSAGNAGTQLTWMDAKFGDTVFTSRHGKPVEINALWYHGLRMLEKLSAPTAPEEAAQYRTLADQAGEYFARAFWCEAGGYLYDTVRSDGKDPAIRPNQIFAVSLPNSPLSEQQQRSVVACVRKHLLTPYGLRSLAPGDAAYRPRCEGNPFERDSAYHQGTVWGWLIGPYVEAYLRVNGFSADARAEIRRLLEPLIRHLDEACIGSVSEIFDGDAPHTPRGAVAQAWSVSELLRAWRMSAPSAR